MRKGGSPSYCFFDVIGNRGYGTLLTLTQFDCNKIPVSDGNTAYPEESWNEILARAARSQSCHSCESRNPLFHSPDISRKPVPQRISFPESPLWEQWIQFAVDSCIKSRYITSISKKNRHTGRKIWSGSQQPNLSFLQQPVIPAKAGIHCEKRPTACHSQHPVIPNILSFLRKEESSASRFGTLPKMDSCFRRNDRASVRHSVSRNLS
jgi:hypothetical protein